MINVNSEWTEVTAWLRDLANRLGKDDATQVRAVARKVDVEVGHDATNEEWRSAPDDWPYEVSSHGRVRRTRDGGSNVAKAGRYLRPAPQRDGYYHVTFRDGARRPTRTYKLHVLVCEAFHGPPPDGTVLVRHLDGDESNLAPENLAWGTYQDNADDAIRHGRSAPGESNPQARFTQLEVDALRREFDAVMAERRAGGFKYAPRGWLTEKAEAHGVSRVAVYRVVRGQGYERKAR